MLSLEGFHGVAAKLYYTRHCKFFSAIIYQLQFLIFNSSVPPTVQIGKGTRFAYRGIGVVVHGKARIGSNCVIGQGVTIGGRSRIPEVPIIGDNVYIAAGARIIGDVKIGDGAVIGANAVVIKDVEENCVVAGVPARVIKRDVNGKDYW